MSSTPRGDKCDHCEREAVFFNSGDRVCDAHAATPPEPACRDCGEPFSRHTPYHKHHAFNAPAPRPRSECGEPGDGR